MIEIQNRQKKHRIEAVRYRRLLGRLARRYRLIRPALTLVFCGDAAMRKLNRAYRKKDRTTDVLSFPIRTRAADGRFYLGDIVISVPQAERQARRFGHGLGRELETLIVHGFLHLLGYDHDADHAAEETAVGALLWKG